VSLVRIFVWTFAVLLILGELGLNLGPFLAGASIVGVALGFGTQSLVKDFVSGFFILVEDQYGVGDVITIADVTGTVEEINLRVTRLRSSDGTVWFVPNGEIRKVGNSAREFARSIVDVIIPNKADLAAAMTAIADEAAALVKEPAWAEAVLEDPEVLGVESIGAENVTVRVSTKITPSHRAPLAREMRSRISSRLQRDGVVSTETNGSGATPES
jgi:small conductance mechanosensitive channel